MSGEADFNWITSDLAVGAAPPCGAAANLATVHGVSHVIDLRDEACDDAAELAACGLALLSLPTVDQQAPTQAMLDEGVDFARQARRDGRSLLIHCQHGVGRSATLALCVLVDRGLDPLEALALAKERREPVSPSPAQYEAWAAWLARRAPQARIPDFAAFQAIAYRSLAPDA